MKIYKEESLRNFQFWSGAKYHADLLSYKDLEQLEFILDDLYPEGIDETTLNDIMWFDFDQILDWLGYDPENFDS